MKAVAGALVLALGAGLLIEPPAHAARELRGVTGLARAYDFILDARFDQVEPELQKACAVDSPFDLPARSLAQGRPFDLPARSLAQGRPFDSPARPLAQGRPFDSPASRSLAQGKPQVRAPREACEVLAATALWWRIQLDPDSRALDPQFSDTVEAAIASTEAWAERSPTDAEAWFYMGGAYAARVQWRVLRDQKLSAARDGKRILEALEEALRLDPSLDDAYFGMGMYKYYADVAPTAAKMLRFLLLLPGGDREEGLEQMLRARDRGRLLQGEADYQLSIIYLWYENQVPRAITLLEQLHAQYPGNPLFLAEIAHIQDAYQHDLTASLATWHALLASAREQRANAPGLAETRARLGIAQKLDALHQTDLAIEHLHAVIERRPTAPFGSLPLAYLRLGEAHDRLGARADAVAAYRSAERLIPSPDVHGIRSAVAGHLRRAPDAKQADAYRSSLNGWRQFEANDLTAATAALERALALNGTDPVTRYRMGRVQQALKQDPAALAQFEMAIRHAKQAPPPILGNAYLEAARLHERAGRRDAALSYYAVAASLFGAAADTRTAATRAITRLRDREPRAPHH